MKAVKDGNVPDRVYYYLLDWNDTNQFRALADKFRVSTLRELTKAEFWELFDIAVRADKELSY